MKNSPSIVLNLTGYMHIQEGLYFYRALLENNSIRCNPFLTQQIILGSKRCRVEGLSSLLLGDSI